MTRSHDRRNTYRSDRSPESNNDRLAAEGAQVPARPPRLGREAHHLRRSHRSRDRADVQGLRRPPPRIRVAAQVPRQLRQLSAGCLDDGGSQIMTRPNDRAFPTPEDAMEGMTIREHFACQILAGLVAGSKWMLDDEEATLIANRAT